MERLDHFVSLLASMVEQGGRVLDVELVALAVLLGLAWWRIHMRTEERDEAQRSGEEPDFDMRRDGQRFNV